MFICHIMLNTPVLVRSLKVSNNGPGLYLDGRLHGISGCCWLPFWSVRDNLLLERHFNEAVSLLNENQDFFMRINTARMLAFISALWSLTPQNTYEATHQKNVQWGTVPIVTCLLLKSYTRWPRMVWAQWALIDSNQWPSFSLIA